MVSNNTWILQQGTQSVFCGKKKGRIAGMYLVSAMMNSKAMKKNKKFTMTDGMMMSYRKVIEKAKKQQADR